MRTSDTIAQLARALAVAQGELPNVPRDAVGQVGNQRRPYADLASVTDTCRPVFAKHRLAYVQGCSAGHEGHVTITTRVVHESGEWIEDSLSMPTGNGTPQAVGSAITYGRRYALMAILGLAADDDDGQAASDQPIKPGKRDPSKPQDARTKKAMLMFAQLGYKERDARLKLTSEIVGREVESWNDASDDEKDLVLDELEAQLTAAVKGKPKAEPKGEPDQPALEAE